MFCNRINVMLQNLEMEIRDSSLGLLGSSLTMSELLAEGILVIF